MAKKVATSLSSTITLRDGVEMPMLGLGTYKITTEGGQSAAISTIKAAVHHGYRLLDTASFYGNEATVGQAIRESCVKREDLFVVTKVFFDDHGYDNTIKAVNTSLEKLGTGYVDLFLIHNPIKPKILETYDALVHMQKQGLIRSVGVSNFRVAFLEELEKAGRPTPSVNQIELHPFCTRNSEPIVEYCKQHGIAVMGWGPLAKGLKFEDPLIQKLAQKYSKSAAQIMVRWCVQKGYITIPKSSSETRVIENANVFNWSLSPEDEAELDRLPHWSHFENRKINILTQKWEG